MCDLAVAWQIHDGDATQTNKEIVEFIGASTMWDEMNQGNVLFSVQVMTRHARIDLVPAPHKR